MESVVSKVMNRREGDNKRALIKKVTGAIVQEESVGGISQKFPISLTWLLFISMT